MRKTLIAAFGAVAAVVAVGACGYNANKTTAANDAQPAAQPVQGRQQAAGKPAKPGNQAGLDAGVGQAKVLKVSTVPGLAPIVTSATGRTVYRFDNDSANPSKTTCLGECAQTWEPVMEGSGVVVEGGGIDEAKLGTVARPEGKQVTLKGWPLYYFKDDVKLGQLAGQGSGDVWFAISPTGGKAKPTTAVKEKPAKPGVQVLKVSSVDGFMPFVTNEKGRTVYRFDNDSNNPARTTCFGDCLKKWEPVLAGENGFEVRGSQIKKGDVGTIDRPEGKQLTLKGWPLYYFHTDKKLGQTAGYGIGNVWFPIAANGKKALRCT